MLNWHVPHNIKDLRGFLGLTGYYWKFIKNYAHIGFPLNEQLWKENYDWTDKATLTFESPKHAWVTAPVLSMNDFIVSFILNMETSGYGLRAVLL